jgi:hypothetical protein
MKEFKRKGIYLKFIETFDEESAPDWLTSKNTVEGSTMDQRWFWNDYVLTLGVNESVETDFSVITRIK